LYRILLQTGDRERYYDLRIPASLPEHPPATLVLNFHGGGGNPRQHRDDSQFDALAEEDGFLLVYPAGTSPMGNFLTWNIGLSPTFATRQNVDDIGYVRAILADLSRMVPVDPRRVFATGFSQGATLCYRLACELSTVIAAIAPVSGVMHVPESERHPERPIPILHFHGRQDPLVLYQGGPAETPAGIIDRPGVEDTIRWWVKQNGLPETPSAQERRGQAELVRFGPAHGGADVSLWTLQDGGHTWPGGRSSLPEERAGRINHDISATRLIGEFFRNHPMP
jgi:polyhydroxybutyrate depolymerase